MCTQVGAAVVNSSNASSLMKISHLQSLELWGEAEALQEEVVEMLEATKAYAEGSAGDSHKYMAAAEVVKGRWLLFQAVQGYLAIEACCPTIEMVERFTVFMGTTRQKRSREGRLGLGDSALNASGVWGTG